MKRLLLLFSLLFSISFYGQNDTLSVVKNREYTVEPATISVDGPFHGVGHTTLTPTDTISVAKKETISIVSADEMNVVYRGVPNPISIRIPEGIKYTVSAPGLHKKGNEFYLNPGSGTEVIVVVVCEIEGKAISEIHKFKIVDMPPLELQINNDRPLIICNKCIFELAKWELKNAQFKLRFNRAFLYDTDLNISSISIDLPNKKNIQNKGNILSEELISEIQKLEKGTIITLKISLEANTEIFIPTIKIMLAD